MNYFPGILRLAGGQFEGRPFVLHESQEFRVGSLFGWKWSAGPNKGKRRFRRFYDEEGKGNGKSPMLAGIGLYGLTADDEERAEIYAGGSTRDQAMVLFRDAVAMVAQSKALSKRCTLSGGSAPWNIAYLLSNSFFRTISSEARKSGSGPRPHMALCDEVHEHPDGLMIEMMERGFKSREQPLLAMATNSGSDRQSVCWSEHQHGIRVAAGTMTPDELFTYVGEVVDDTAFSFICSLDPGDDPFEDPSCWPKANPLLGVTVKQDYLQGVVNQAKMIPGKANNIKRLHFCEWTDAETAWMNHATVEAVLADFNPEVLHAGKTVYIGVDLSATQDMTAIGCVTVTGHVDMPGKPLPDGTPTDTVRKPTYDAWIEAWTPGDTLKERAMRDEAPYDLWVDQGFLNAPPGKLIRMDYLAARIAEINSLCVIGALGYDQYAFRKHFEPALDELGLRIANVVEHPQGGKRRAQATEKQIEDAKRNGEPAPQGLWMPGSVVEAESLFLERRIRIRRSPVLYSAIMSATLESDPWENRWLSKQKAVNRIDALVALVIAIGVAESFSKKPLGKSVYEKRGLLFV
jgi:phage terminase large subunit-like protein